MYLAADAAGRQVALKLIRDELAGDVGFRIRFAQEMAAARAVAGVCTAALIAADPKAEPPWLATEYVPGPSLADLVAAEGPISAALLRPLAVGLAEALAAIHHAGVVHRDLKPSNVLLASDRPHVIDFGVAAAVEGSALTRSGLVLGSPGYMAPEQVTGAAPVGPATDIFAWALVVLYAATGRSPFGQGPSKVLLFRVVHQEPDLAGIPAPIAPLLAAALNKDPTQRPTARGLLEQLTSSTADLATATTRILKQSWQLTTAISSARLASRTTLDRLRTSCSTGLRTCRRWLVPLTIVALILAALGATAAILSRARPVRPAAPPPASHPTSTLNSVGPRTTQSASAGRATGGASTTGPGTTLPSPGGGGGFGQPYQFDPAAMRCLDRKTEVGRLEQDENIQVSVDPPTMSVAQPQSVTIGTRHKLGQVGETLPLIITVYTPSGRMSSAHVTLDSDRESQVQLPASFSPALDKAERGAYTLVWSEGGNSVRFYVACWGFQFI